jgi:biopolymer transport protein ExbD
MAFSASSAGQQSEINVTPLIDVLLVLLIIFMVIVPVMPRGLESRVPQPPNAARPTVGPVSLRVLGDSAAHVQRYEVDGRIVDRQQLAAALLASLRIRADRTVFVSASPQLSYGAIATAVGAAKGAGATAIALGRL